MKRKKNVLAIPLYIAIIFAVLTLFSWASTDDLKEAQVATETKKTAHEALSTAFKYELAEPPESEYLGTFTVTAYCPCEKCCGKWSNLKDPRTASGQPAKEGITVGADWDTLPKGSAIEIEGIGERVVQDRPAGWIVEKYDGMIIDLYFDSHEEALKFGKRELKVYRRE